MSGFSSHEEKPAPPLSGSDLAEPIFSDELLEALPDAIIAVDQLGTIVKVNSQAQVLFGYTRGELIGQKVEILVPESFRPRHHDHRQSFAETPKTRRMGADLDLYGRRRNGSEFPVEISLSPVSTKGGMVVLSAIRDITDRKRIAEELRRANQELHDKTIEQLGESRTRLASIIDSSEDAIIGKNLDGTIVSWNKGAERIYGYTPEEVIGKNISLLAPSDRPDEIPEILRKIGSGDSVEHLETVRVAKDGRRLNVSITVSPLLDAKGEIVGASAIARDTTDQKRVEKQLQQAQKMEAIGRLAGGIAHDFNNILGIVNACSEFLNDTIERGSPSSVYIENIKKATERGSALTRQLLSFSRSSAIQPSILDLNERLKEIGKLLRPLMGDDVEILIVPKSSTAVVEADAGQLDQILMNLAVNARDAMPNGGKFILETAEARFDQEFAEQNQISPPGKYVMLAASDTGTGMDQATLSHIFEPFFTTKEIGKGTGLGLATVYGIVKQGAGHIRVYSEPGHGTTFKIYLPSAEHKLGFKTKIETEAVPPQTGSATILLVEDDPIMRSLTRQLLEQHGYTVVEADDGRTTLEVVGSRSKPVDLVLTDVVMRRMSGPEMVDNLRALNPNLKVVYMSGYTGELIAEREVLKRGIPLLEKPFNRNNLLKIIETTLG